MGCHFFLQGIFLTQELNLGLLHWQADSLLLSHKGSQRLNPGIEVPKKKIMQIHAKKTALNSLMFLLYFRYGAKYFV